MSYSSGIGDFGAVLAPFAGLLECFAGTVQYLGPIETVRWIASNSSPYGDVIELFAQTTADAFDGPDCTVLGGVLEQDGVASVM